MSHSGLTVQYYDAEDQALLRQRAAREQRGHAHSHAPAPTPVAAQEPEVPVFQERTAPPPEYVQALLGHEAAPYDPNRDAFSRGIDVAREAEAMGAASVGGVPGATCAAGSQPRSSASTGNEQSAGPSNELDLLSLNMPELARWLVMAYLPTRFGVWLGERRASKHDEGR